jgi:hypothetical protein
MPWKNCHLNTINFFICCSENIFRPTCTWCKLEETQTIDGCKPEVTISIPDNTYTGCLTNFPERILDTRFTNAIWSPGGLVVFFETRCSFGKCIPCIKPYEIFCCSCTLTLSVPDAGYKSDWWRPYFLFLLIARLFVVRLTQNQVQMKEN